MSGGDGAFALIYTSMIQTTEFEHLKNPYT
jgi:hypothetical protein